VIPVGPASVVQHDPNQIVDVLPADDAVGSGLPVVPTSDVLHLYRSPLGHWEDLIGFPKDFIVLLSDRWIASWFVPIFQLMEELMVVKSASQDSAQNLSAGALVGVDVHPQTVSATLGTSGLSLSEARSSPSLTVHDKMPLLEAKIASRMKFQDGPPVVVLPLSSVVGFLVNLSGLLLLIGDAVKELMVSKQASVETTDHGRWFAAVLGILSGMVSLKTLDAGLKLLHDVFPPEDGCSLKDPAFSKTRMLFETTNATPLVVFIFRRWVALGWSGDGILSVLRECFNWCRELPFGRAGGHRPGIVVWQNSKHERDGSLGSGLSLINVKGSSLPRRGSWSGHLSLGPGSGLHSQWSTVTVSFFVGGVKRRMMSLLTLVVRADGHQALLFFFLSVVSVPKTVLAETVVHDQLLPLRNGDPEVDWTDLHRMWL